jgi:hypothetical protein
MIYVFPLELYSILIFMDKRTVVYMLEVWDLAVNEFDNSVNIE